MDPEDITQRADDVKRYKTARWLEECLPSPGMPGITGKCQKTEEARKDSLGAIRDSVALPTP